MKYRLRFHELVSEDLSKAINWYESQRDGLGQEFDFELTQSIERLHQAPLSHSYAFPDVRFKCVHRFPYVVSVLSGYKSNRVRWLGKGLLPFGVFGG